MILVKIKDNKYDGIINLEFIKTIYIQFKEYENKYVLKACDGKGDCIILAESFLKVTLEAIIKEISLAYEDNVKVIYLKEDKIQKKVIKWNMKKKEDLLKK